MVEFYQTVMGRQFYEGTMPRIAAALEAIAFNMKKAEAERAAPKHPPAGEAVTPEKEFSVIGYYPDTQQRFVGRYLTDTHAAAERMAQADNDGLVVVGSVYLRARCAPFPPEFVWDEEGKVRE